MAFKEVTTDDLIYSKVTPKRLGYLSPPDQVLISVLKAGSFNYRKPELAVIEMFFYRRLAKYDFQKLSDMLPLMAARLNIATIFFCAILFNKKLNMEEKKNLLATFKEPAEKIGFYKDTVAVLETQWLRSQDPTTFSPKDVKVTEKEYWGIRKDNRTIDVLINLKYK